MLEVKKVSKMYTNHRGVDEIDFTINRGEIVGFLGPNGAGKTTTMRMITGYLNPTKGSILVDGLSMADHPKKVRRKIGYLPETPPLYPEMTVGDYLKFVAQLRDVPTREQKLRISEVIGKLGLQGREKQIIRSLSKGYKQRVGLAQAIVHKPDLLIMDEPTSGLDPKQIIEIRQLIRELGENHTVLLSTHILPEVNAICNRVLIINQGRVVLDGKPDNLAQSMGERFEVNLEVRGPREIILREIGALPLIESVEAIPSADSVEEAFLAEESVEHSADESVAQDVPEGAADEETAESGLTLVPATGATISETSTVKLHVLSKDRTDVRESLFFRLAELGYPILEMKRMSLSLEDIFLKLTTEEPVGLEGDAPASESEEDTSHA